MAGRLVSLLLGFASRTFSRTGEQHLRRHVVDKLADNESFQKFVVTTNKAVAKNTKLAQGALEDSMAKLPEPGSVLGTAKDFVHLFKEELKKDLRRKE